MPTSWNVFKTSSLPFNLLLKCNSSLSWSSGRARLNLPFNLLLKCNVENIDRLPEPIYYWNIGGEWDRARGIKGALRGDGLVRKADIDRVWKWWRDEGKAEYEGRLKKLGVLKDATGER